MIDRLLHELQRAAFIAALLLLGFASLKYGVLLFVATLLGG